MKTLFSSEIMISTTQKVEPGTAAWKGTMLIVTPPTPDATPSL